MASNIPMIAVIGSGKNEYPSLSVPLGRWLAENGYSLINGGGGGVMLSTARAFKSVKNRTGFIVGIIPSSSDYFPPEESKPHYPPPSYPNQYTEIVIQTHLHLSGSMGKMFASRNHIIVLSAEKIVALPGGNGTQSEIELAIEYKKPLILLSQNDEWNKYKKYGLIAKTVEQATEKI